MSPLILYDGKLLIQNNGLATSEACCCTSGNACCLPERCVLTGRVVFNPELEGEAFDIPGYTVTSSGMTATGFTIWYEKQLPPDSSICAEYDPDWDGETPNAYWDEYYSFRDAFFAQAANPAAPGETFNTPSSGLLPPEIGPASCVENLSGEDCQSQGGTYHAGKTCEEQTCCSGSCDEENPCPTGCECVDGECVTCPDVFYCCVPGAPFPNPATADFFTWTVAFEEIDPETAGNLRADCEYAGGNVIRKSGCHPPEENVCADNPLP